MEKISEITEKIKILKQAREILQNEYKKSEFHKKKEASSQDLVPPSPGDKEIYKLLTAIQQLDFHIKKLQDEQFEILKKEK
jgi:curved DNA-binding protein CbpA